MRINPLEVNEDDLHLLKTHHLPRLRFGEDSHVAPPYTKMGEAHFEKSSIGLYLDDDHHVMPSSMGYIGYPIRCMLMEKCHTMGSYDTSWLPSLVC